MSASALWETYIQHFSFTQLGWIFETFNVQAVDGRIEDASRLSTIISEWLEHQWGGVLKRREACAPLIEQALGRFGMPMEFVTVIEFLKHYEAIHLENEENAGFPMDSIQVLHEIFLSHCAHTDSRGLKGKALFGVLDDLDIKFNSKEEREWYVDTVKRLDKSGDGFINFAELCQIIRIVVDKELVKKRLREFDLIKSSNLPYDEVEDWNVLFQEKDEEGQGELQLIQVKDLMTSIGVKWDGDFSTTVKGWLLEADENNNGTIDFGEFCVLISRLWASNINDIRGACRKFLKNDTVTSVKSVHGRYMTVAPTGEVTCTATEVGTSETLTMIRLASGNVMLKSAAGRFLVVSGDQVRCTEEKNGTQFKVNTQEDERVILTVSGPQASTLYCTPDGAVAVSDGNPEHEPNFPFTLRQEELEKKCWSRTLAPRKPSKLVVEKRQVSKMRVRTQGAQPHSPGAQAGMDDLDRVLEENMRTKSKA